MNVHYVEFGSPMTACGRMTEGIFAVGMPRTAVRADVTCVRCLREMDCPPTAPEAASGPGGAISDESSPTSPETDAPMPDCSSDEGHRFTVVKELGGVVLWRCARCNKEYLQY